MQVDDMNKENIRGIVINIINSDMSDINKNEAILELISNDKNTKDIVINILNNINKDDDKDDDDKDDDDIDDDDKDDDDKDDDDKDDDDIDDDGIDDDDIDDDDIDDDDGSSFIKVMKEINSIRSIETSRDNNGPNIFLPLVQYIAVVMGILSLIGYTLPIDEYISVFITYLKDLF